MTGKSAPVCALARRGDGAALSLPLIAAGWATGEHGALTLELGLSGAASAVWGAESEALRMAVL